MRTGMRCAFAFMFLVMIAGITSVSSAQQQQYVRGNIVFVLPATTELDGTAGRTNFSGFEFDLDSTVGVVGAVGARLDQGRDAWEGEFEVGYRSMKLDKLSTPVGSGSLASIGASGDISTTTFMGNIRYMFPSQNQFRPYVGGGLGVASHTFEFDFTEFAKSDSTVFAYQFMVGLAYAVSKQMELQAGFRYLGTADAEIEDSNVSYTYQTYGFDFGATFRF